MTLQADSGNLNFETSGGKAILFANGNFGINVASASAKLQVGGDAMISGTMTSNDYYSPSDRRLKENIKPIDNALEKVLSLQGVSYKWNDKAKNIKSIGFEDSNKTQIGLIAQDVEKVFPELIHTWTATNNVANETNATKNSTNVEEQATEVEKSVKDEFKAVDYSRLSAVIVEAMREQRSMMEDLEAEIKKLENQFNKQ